MKATPKILVGLSLFALTSVATAQEWEPTKEALSDAYPGKAYSPYARRTFPERPLWGDTHLHTSLSMDAGVFGNRLGPREAYRAARGEDIMASSGQPVRLSRPLDWLMVADHTDGLGMADDVINAAEEFNEPGRFTALMRFEWTSLVNGGNLHRNVIFRDGADRVRQVMPYTTQAPIGKPKGKLRV